MYTAISQTLFPTFYKYLRVALCLSVCWRVSSLCPQVHWVQQQHAKRRTKRDFSSFGEFPSLFGTGGLEHGGLVGRAAVPLQQTHHQPQYRGAGYQVPQDPIFKEQWYMVSTRSFGASWRSGTGFDSHPLHESLIYCDYYPSYVASLSP